MSSDRAGSSFPLQPLRFNILGALLASTCQPFCKLKCFVCLSVSPLHCPKAVFFFFSNWKFTCLTSPGVNAKTYITAKQLECHFTGKWLLCVTCRLWGKSTAGEQVIKMHPARAGKHCFSFWCSVIQTCDLIKVRNLLIILEYSQSQVCKDRILMKESSFCTKNKPNHFLCASGKRCSFAPANRAQRKKKSRR